jgi:hypothetical protein
MEQARREGALGMADRFYLSIWLKGHSEADMLDCFRVALEAFPYSKSRGLIRGLRVYPLDWNEAPILEEDFPDGVSTETALALASEFLHADCAYEVSAFWDLWVFQKNGGPSGWKLAPSPIKIFCHGPEFDRGRQGRGDLEIDFGLDTPFRADQRTPDAEARALTQDYRERLQENIRKLLDYIRVLTERLPIDKKALWTDSGENFAEMVKRSFR